MNLSVPSTRVSGLSSEEASSERDSCQVEAGDARVDGQVGKQ